MTYLHHLHSIDTRSAATYINGSLVIRGTRAVKTSPDQRMQLRPRHTKIITHHRSVVQQSTHLRRHAEEPDPDVHRPGCTSLWSVPDFVDSRSSRKLIYVSDS